MAPPQHFRRSTTKTPQSALKPIANTRNTHTHITQKHNTLSILIQNIAQLLQTEEQTRTHIKGSDMQHLSSIKNAYLWIQHNRIADFGTMDDMPPLLPQIADTTLDAKNKLVLPTWCDSHTHIVYAGSRENEFVQRIQGATYEQIAEAGGGILNSAKRLQNTTAYDLYDSALYRLTEICRMGTGAVEIKSGYGLSLEAEIKMLRVIQQLKAASPLTIKATFLGAHALPTEYKNNREGYINLLINQMLPQIADEGLADFIDVFCEKGFFTADETAKILTAGAKHGLRAKIHANQLHYSGGVQVGVQHNALSVDHLECVGDAEIDCLLNSQTMPTLLPSAAFFLNLPYQPARRMIDAGLPIALATDYNPGSSPSGNMPFVISLACTQMKMLPNEAINAATLNSAYAMDVAPNLGSIARNKIANIQIINAPSVAYIPYSFGSQLTQTVILNGKVI